MRKIVDTILPAQEPIHVVQRGGGAPRPQDRSQRDLDFVAGPAMSPGLAGSSPEARSAESSSAHKKIPDTFSASPASSGTRMDLGRPPRATVRLRRCITTTYSLAFHLLERAKYIMGLRATTMFAAVKIFLVIIIDLPGLRRWKKIRWKGRHELYDLLYSMQWDSAVTNNYGFAPAETDGPERFQLQLYTELIKLLEVSGGEFVAKNVLEISCGRGGGFCRLIDLLPVQSHAIGLDFSINAIRYCTHRYTDHPNVAFVCGHALHLPFRDMSFDVVVNVEASHVYRDDAAFLREVSRVLARGGKFLYADYRRRYNVPTLERLARDTGFSGTFHDITANVVAACQLDAGRRQALIRAAVPWYYRGLANERLKRYAAIPGTPNFERFRGGDRLYFMTCLTRLR